MSNTLKSVKPSIVTEPINTSLTKSDEQNPLTNNVYQQRYQLVDMKYITNLTGMTNKWFYSLIKQSLFPKPIKLGRASRWMLCDIERWIEEKRLN